MAIVVEQLISPPFPLLTGITPMKKVYIPEEIMKERLRGVPITTHATIPTKIPTPVIPAPVPIPTKVVTIPTTPVPVVTNNTIEKLSKELNSIQVRQKRMQLVINELYKLLGKISA